MPEFKKAYVTHRILVLAIVCFYSVPVLASTEGPGRPYIDDSITHPLLDEVQTPETKRAKEFWDIIATSNVYPNKGTIRQGKGRLDESIDYLSKGYLSRVTTDDYLGSFENKGDFNLLQLYSADSRGVSGNGPLEKRVFFEISVLVGEEAMPKDLFLGGTPPETTGASARVYYGFMSFVEEEGSLKIDKITFHPEFPLGGGHQPWRDGVEYMAQLAIGNGFNHNNDMDTSNCSSREVHPGRLVYVTCKDETGSQKKTAKMVYPMSSSGGWVCIQVLDNSAPVDRTDPLQAGKKFALKKEFDKAILEYQKAIDQDGNDYKAYELMGYSYFRLGKNAMAVKALERSIAIKPDHVMGHYNLALAYWANGQQKEAVGEVRKVIGLDPGYRKKIKDDPQFKDFVVSDEFDAVINP